MKQTKKESKEEYKAVDDEALGEALTELCLQVWQMTKIVKVQPK